MVDRATGDLGERLVAEADAEDRKLRAPEHLQRDADVPRVVGTPRGPAITTLSTGEAASSSQARSSLRTTMGSRPLTSPSRWKRLKVKES
jgi:hypothetical protein